MKYFINVITRGLTFVKNGKLFDCFSHFFDMFYVYLFYNSKNNQLRQEKMLKKSLKYAQKHCTYYQRLIKDHNKLNIKEYPILTKDLIKENFKDIASNNIDKMIYNLAHTGGSTGQPLEFYNANGLDDYFWTKLWQRNGYQYGDLIISMMGVKLDDSLINNRIYWKNVKGSETSYGAVQLSSLYLNDDNIKDYYEFLCSTKPNFIRGYPSFIYEISKYVIDNNLVFPFKCKTIVLTSENSYEYQWQIIEKAFNCNVILQYGHTECCVFAYSDSNKNILHVEPLYGYVEILDDNMQEVKVGETGKVVVTSLHNNVMPLIRYDTGDMAIYGGKDNNGILLNRIMGRTQDYIVNKKNEKVLLTALIFAQHFNAMGHINKWQIEQFEAGMIIIHIIKGIDYSDSDENEIRYLFDNLGHCSCAFDYVDSIQKTPRGKSMMLIQHLKM